MVSEDEQGLATSLRTGRTRETTVRTREEWVRLGDLAALRVSGPEEPVATLVVLHGWRQSARMMAQRCRSFAARYDVYCLQGPLVAASGRAWFHWVEGDVERVERDVAEISTRVRAALSAVPGPAAVLGYSQGGLVAAGAVLSAPGTADALVVIKNALVEMVAPDRVATHRRLRELPILLMVSDADTVAYPELARSSAVRLRGLGMNLRLEEGDRGHDLSDADLKVAHRFLEDLELRKVHGRPEAKERRARGVDREGA